MHANMQHCYHPYCWNAHVTKWFKLHGIHMDAFLPSHYCVQGHRLPSHTELNTELTYSPTDQDGIVQRQSSPLETGRLHHVKQIHGTPTSCEAQCTVDQILLPLISWGHGHKGLHMPAMPLGRLEEKYHVCICSVYYKIRGTFHYLSQERFSRIMDFSNQRSLGLFLLQLCKHGESSLYGHHIL